MSIFHLSNRQHLLEPPPETCLKSLLLMGGKGPCSAGATKYRQTTPVWSAWLESSCKNVVIFSLELKEWGKFIITYVKTAQSPLPPVQLYSIHQRWFEQVTDAPGAWTETFGSPVFLYSIQNLQWVSENEVMRKYFVERPSAPGWRFPKLMSRKEKWVVTNSKGRDLKNAGFRFFINATAGSDKQVNRV